MIQKGMVTKEEAQRVRAEADALRTNSAAMPPADSKWKINKAIQNIELYGDLRVRYEQREGTTPDNSRLQLDRGRYSARIGLRGDAFDDFYYGLRLETASNPRSPWVTFGTSSSGIPYQGPYGKSTAGINVGQLYLGWHPEKWVDLTVGKMPNPLYTTTMVWDSDLNPEGLAERFKYTVGNADFFATFGQFIYQDVNPNYASGGLGFNGLLGQDGNTVFQLAYQGGLTYHFSKDVSAKVAATLYTYQGLLSMPEEAANDASPYFSDPYVGEGQFTGAGTAYPVNGASGYGTSSSLPGNSSLGFPNNQVGLNHLMVLEIPAEVNFKISKFNARVFGDFAYNLEGSDRAKDAAAGYANYLSVQNSLSPVNVTPFSPQTADCKAYQIGFAIGNKDCIGLVNGTACKKHAWEVRTYWQHVEQYALDPNLLDSDFFEGRGNLEGIYAAVAYGITDNLIGTFRYGHASRINEKLGTGGSNQDMPQLNPIEKYNLLQIDLTFKF
jgi:hypothetical protein